MPALRSPALALALLGACPVACFNDEGPPRLGADADTGVTDGAPTTTSTSTTSATTTTSATSTGDTTGEATTTEVTTATATSTGCVPVDWYFDVDKDGFGGSTSTQQCDSPGPMYLPDSLDCDDSKPAVNPNAAEVCDGIDNDCDGGIDEYPAGELGECNGCSVVIGPNSTYYICQTPALDWDSARARCKTLLGDLVSINSGAELDYIKDQLPKVQQGWWVGLGDGASEGQLVWVDNSSLDLKVVPWADGEPNNSATDDTEPANCVVMTSGFLNFWYTDACAFQYGMICEAPLPS